MRPAFAAQLKLPCFFGVEENHCLNARAAIFRAPKADHVNACAPCHIGRAAAQGHQRIGKTRPVQMGLLAKFPRHCGQVGQFLQAVDLAAFGDLGDRHRPALWPVHTACFFGQIGAAQRLGAYFIARAHQGELGAAAVKFWGIAFILVDMGHGRTHDRLERLAQGGQSQRIGGCARGHQINGRLWRLENIAQGLGKLGHDFIFAIGHGKACIRIYQRLHHSRMRRPGIVRGEKHQTGSSMMWSSQSSSSISNSGTVRPCIETLAACTLSGVPDNNGCHA